MPRYRADRADRQAVVTAQQQRHAARAEFGVDRVVRKPGESCFAGSSLAPDEGLANIERWIGLSSHQARELFSTDISSNFGIDLPDLKNDSLLPAKTSLP